jgi:hypothetical protein
MRLRASQSAALCASLVWTRLRNRPGAANLFRCALATAARHALPCRYDQCADISYQGDPHVETGSRPAGAVCVLSGLFTTDARLSFRAKIILNEEYQGHVTGQRPVVPVGTSCGSGLTGIAGTQLPYGF